jgi:hypothetical protein
MNRSYLSADETNSTARLKRTAAGPSSPADADAVADDARALLPVLSDWA